MAEQKIEMKVSGMHCAACSSRIEKVVGNLEGIDTCSVNLATEQATVLFDASITGLQEITDAIGKMGFSAAVKTDESDSQD